MSNNPEKVIREACIKANPTDSRWNVLLADNEKVRLADVLLAIQGRNYLVDDLGVFWKFTKGGNPHYEVDYNNAKAERWDLTKDDLSLQSPETLEFLATLL